MTTEKIRLGAQIRVINRVSHRYHQLGRYMGPTDLPGMKDSHRVCFDGKVQLLAREDFAVLTDEN